MGLFNFLFGEGQALAFIKGAISKGLGLEAITSALEAGGIAIRSQKVEEVFNYLAKTILPDLEYIKRLQLHNLPNITRIPISPTAQKRNFNYVVTVQGFRPSGEKPESFQVEISTNVLLTKQEAIDMAASIGEGETKSGGLESAAGTVESIFQRPAGLFLP